MLPCGRSAGRADRPAARGEPPNRQAEARAKDRRTRFHLERSVREEPARRGNGRAPMVSRGDRDAARSTHSARRSAPGSAQYDNAAIGTAFCAKGEISGASLSAVRPRDVPNAGKAPGRHRACLTPPRQRTASHDRSRGLPDHAGLTMHRNRWANDLFISKPTTRRRDRKAQLQDREIGG